jgi:2-polyprenyl-3-methyl-5-hydroxy-6-metoxy-1,4-benzoquinol methylase
MGLLEKKGNFYVNTAISKKYLCKAGTSYAGDYFIHLQSIKDYWAGLYGSLRTNKMARPGKRSESDYAKQLKKFLYAMDAIGRIKSGYIKKIFPIGRYRNMLDLGGGMGTYAVNFARENRSLNVIVYDLKNVAVHAKKYIKEEGMQGRIKVFAGQCIDDPLPEGPFDIVFISNLLHIYDKQDCKKIIRKSAELLEQNGALLIHDYIFGSGRTLAIPLFDLTMLVGTPQGRCYGKKDLTEWMKSAGISQIKTSEVIAGSSIVWGKKR